MNMERYITKLEQKLKSVEDNLYCSAQHGKDLLDEIAVLKQKIAQDEAKIEILQQDNHTMKIQLDVLHKSEESTRDELDYTQRQYNEVRFKEQELCKENSSLWERRGELEAELEESRQRESECEKRLEKLQLQVEQMSPVTVIEQSKSFAISDESWQEHQLEMETMKKQQEEFLRIIDEKHTSLENSQKHAEFLENKVQQLQIELEERECQITTHCNSLDKYREEIEDLNTALQLLQLKDTDMNRRGNSIFSEVEDHRQQLEKRYLKQKSKYDALFEENEKNKQFIISLKLQNASLVATAGTKVNAVHVEELERKLVETQAEMRLMVTLEENRTKALHELLYKETKNQGLKNDASGYLKEMVAHSQARCNEYEKECKMLKLKCMTGSEQCRILQHQLIKAEQMTETLRAENMQLKVKLEELALKDAETKENVAIKSVEHVKRKDNKNGSDTASIKNIIQNDEDTTTEQEIIDCNSSTSKESQNVLVTSFSSIPEERMKSSTVRKPQLLKKTKVITISKEKNECNQQ